jgi:hypothetical protein
VSWKTCSILSLLSLSLSLTSTGCISTKPVPKWEGKLWAGDSERAAIRRSQSNEEILASDPRFDGFLAMTYADFRSFYATYVLGCKQWRQGIKMMGPREALERYRIALTDLEDEVQAQELRKTLDATGSEERSHTP